MFFWDLSQNNLSFSTYNRAKEKLMGLDSMGFNHKRATIHAWKLAGWFEVRVDNRIFGYSWDGGSNIVIWETYLLKKVGNKIQYVDEGKMPTGNMLFEDMDYFSKRKYIRRMITFED